MKWIERSKPPRSFARAALDAQHGNNPAYLVTNPLGWDFGDDHRPSHLVMFDAGLSAASRELSSAFKPTLLTDSGI
jgi:hypothetical protein